MNREISLKSYILALITLFMFGLVFVVFLIAIPYLVYLLFKLFFIALDFSISFVVVFWTVFIISAWVFKILSIINVRPHI